MAESRGGSLRTIHIAGLLNHSADELSRAAPPGEWRLLRILFLFFFFDYPGIFGGLTWSKTLEDLHTHWNLRPLGCRRGWDPGVAQRLYGAPWNTISSHILARIHMKLGTHIDLIEPKNFCAACHGSAQQEVGYSGLFKKHMLWNLKYSSQDFQQTSTKLGERDLKTLGMLNSGGIFDISNGLPVARR